MTDQMSTEEKRDVSGFNALVFKGMGRVDLVQGDHEELVIEAQPEIRSRIQTTVENGTLLIDYNEDWKDWTGFRTLSGDKIRFRLMMREITSLSLAGVGSLDSARVEAPALSLAISGPGLMTIGTLKANRLDASLAGVGSLDVAGSVDEVNITLSGAGSYKAGRLESVKTDIRLSGVGTATVWAKEELNASISGAGVIEYYGSPRISQSNSGLGMLKFMGNR
ncbi:MAG TPA: head GIN domain-containing protein [Anaerolineaceae bacterium]|nr:head GIN domain-containing protein [Anaerolineaceae bacterium]